MTPLEAIEAATANGPLTLGKTMAPLSGQIREGYDADLIAVSRSPLLDIWVLADRGNVTHVWKGGRVCKKPRERGRGE
jgi:imidazolonepropionase-like amidohydrolase